MLFSIQNAHTQCTINYVGGDALDLDVDGAGMATGQDLIDLVQANATPSAGCSVGVFSDATGNTPFLPTEMYDCSTDLGTVITVYAKAEDIVVPTQASSGVISFDVTITDGEAPTFTTLAGNLDRTVDCDDATDLAAAQALVPVAVDNCTATANLIISKTSGTLVSTNGICGTITNTFTATDASGNVSVDFTQTITIEDNDVPTFTIPMDVTIECDESTAVTNTGDVTDEADNCDMAVNATFTDVTTPGACPNSYTITLSLIHI